MSQAPAQKPQTLADHWEQKLKPWFDKHGLKLLILIGVVIVAIVAVWWWRSSVNQGKAERWGAFVLADDSRMEELAEQHEGTPVGDWAKLRHARNLLSDGMRTVLTDRATAIAELRTAKEKFSELVDDSKIDLVRQHALFGMAQAQEVTSEGKVSDAIATYQKLLDDYPKTPYAPAANQAIALLKRSDAADLYKWLAKWSPPETPVNPTGDVKKPSIPDELHLAATRIAPDKPDGMGTGVGPGAPKFPDDPNAKRPVIAPRPGTSAAPFPAPEKTTPAPDKPKPAPDKP